MLGVNCGRDKSGVKGSGTKCVPYNNELEDLHLLYIEQGLNIIGPYIGQIKMIKTESLESRM